jgi:caa(3)-type oxidase subunit IV
MSHDSPEEIRKTVRTFLIVGVTLLILTGVTVAVAELHLSSITERILVALLVAGAKASLVALIFMHLKAEKYWVYFTLAFTGLFLVLVFALPMWTEGDHIVGTSPNHWSAGVEAPHMPTHAPEPAHDGAAH